VPYLVDHPQWPLLLSAGTVLLMGDLESTRHHYDEAKRIEEVFPEKYLKYAWGLTGMVRDMLEEKRLSADRRLLFDLRIPHVFLGAVFLLFIFEIIRRETGSAAAGVLGSFLVMNPEMVARFTSAGWTPAIILTMTVMCYLYLYYPRKHVMAAAAAFLGAWAYQKTVILPLSVLFAELYRKRGRISMTALSSPLGWAVGIGTVSLYGAFLNWGCFYEAFFVTHGVSGMLYSFKNVTGFAAAWARASLNMSWMIFFPAIAGLVYMFKKRRGKRDLVIPFWFLIGTFIFMFTIWPITRNSCLVYPPMIIALALSVSRISKKVLRRFFYFSLAAVHLIHLFIMYPTLRDPNEYYTLNEKGKGPRQALREHYVNMRKDFLRLISGFYYFSGDRDSAAGLYRSAMSPEISSLRSFYDEGISAQDLETIISSDALLEEELNLAPSSEDMVHDIGLLYLPLKNVSYYYSVSAAYEALKQKEKAAEAAEKTIENAKEYLLEEGIYPDIYRSMALAYIYLGKTEQAKDILEKSVELRPTGYKSFTMLAVILSHLGDNEGAMESARKALELAPREPEVCITLGRLYYASGEYDKAVEFFKRCVSHTPETFLKARYELARSYFKSGQDTEAERYYREVIEEQPLHGGAWYGLSVIYYKRGEISKARDYYEKASRYGFMDDVLGYLIQGAGDGDSGRIDGNSITDPDAFRSQGAGQTEDQPGKEIQE
jgi:tetratricopeptide (TPR) repeat protein